MFYSASTKLITLSLFLLAIVSTTAQAEFYDSRAGMWEFYLAPTVTNSKVLEFVYLDFTNVQVYFRICSYTIR